MHANEPSTRPGEPANQNRATDPAPAPRVNAAPATSPNGARRSLRPCPYCGDLGENDGAHEQCPRCKGWFEPLSKQASQNSMGPWFFHDDAVPFRPGCSYQTLRKLITKQRVSLETIIRGPGTNQFWVFARNAPGVAHLLGVCHNCAKPASEDDFLCEHCGAAFPAFEDRQHLGLAPVRLLPGQANPSHVAASALSADPDESNYGPVAPTFATAAVEAATARAEAANTPGAPGAQRQPGETIDEVPDLAAIYNTRRDRRYGRLKAIIAVLVIVIVALLITVGALLIRATSARADQPAPTPPIESPAAATTDPATAQPVADPWTDRLKQARVLIATDDPAQMESALAILRDAETNAPASSIPSDLHEQIDHLAEAIDAAKLRNYLNKNN